MLSKKASRGLGMLSAAAMVFSIAGGAQAYCAHNFVRYDGSCVSSCYRDNPNQCNICGDGKCSIIDKQCWQGNCGTGEHLYQDYVYENWGDVQEVWWYCRADRAEC